MHDDQSHDTGQENYVPPLPNRNPFSDLSRLVKILFILAAAAAIAMGAMFFLDKK